MVEYIENKKNLSSELGRMQAIDFAKSMINQKKSIELKNEVVNDMFNILKCNRELTEFDGNLIQDTIEALLSDYDNLDFDNKFDIRFFSSDINSNLGYIYSFYPQYL